MNVNLPIFLPLSIGLVAFCIAFFRWPKYAIAGLIIAKPIIDVTWDYYILLNINFLKLYAGLFPILGAIYIIIHKIPLLSFKHHQGSLSEVHNFVGSQPRSIEKSPFHRFPISQILILLWLLFILSTLMSAFILTRSGYLVTQLKYVLSVANGFIMFIMVMNVFDPEKDRGFFIKTFLIAGIFPMLLWLIPIVLGTQTYSNDELLRVQGPYQNFWQFAFAGLQTLIFCLAYFSFRSKNSSPFRQRRTSEGEGKGEGVTKSPILRYTVTPKNIIVIIMMIISLLMLYGSFSKAFWLAGFLVLIVGFVLMRKYIFATLIPIIVVIMFFIPSINRDIRKTFSNEIGYYIEHSVPKQQVLRGRLEVWKQALRNYFKFPFFEKMFGAGMGHTFMDNKGIENDYIRVIIEQGFVGFLVYMGLFIIALVFLIQEYSKSNNPIALAGFLSVIALLVLSLGANPLLIPNVQWVVWSSAGLSLYKGSKFV